MDAQTAYALTRAIREHSGMDMSQIRQAGELGADAGWPGFTYTADGAAFADANAALLDDLLLDDSDAFGYDNVAAFVASFARADMADSVDGYKCLLAWYALEECGRFWVMRDEERSA